MSDCLFCGIVDGSVPSTKVADTGSSYAFRDLNPVAPVHVLVVPREHVDSAHALRPEHAPLLADLYATVQEVAIAEGIAESGYRIVANVGREAGMTVPHLHLHVVGGRPMSWPPG